MRSRYKAMARFGGKGMSYIVKNCPSVCFGELCSKLFLSYALKCADCTNCVIKQVIEKCKRIKHYFRGTDNNYCLGKLSLSEDILKMFDIEEINK